jgi:integrase
MPATSPPKAPTTFGEITEYKWRDGKKITYGARFRAYGRRHRVVFGTSAQGWNRVRAEIELESIAQQVERGTWQPQQRKRMQRKPAQQPPAVPLFGAFAQQIVDAKRSHGLDDDTIEDLEWRLGYLIIHLGERELIEIDVAATDGFRDELARHAQAIRRSAERGKPVMATVKTKKGKTYKRHKKPLSNTSINAILRLLSQVLQRADEYGYIDRNPMTVGQRKDRYLPEAKPRRTFLEVDELHALLNAAGELDASPRRDHRIGRRPSLAALGLAGFRVEELCSGLKVSQVDLARARFKLPDAKTPKGVREVEMPVYLHREMLAHYEQRVRDGFPMHPNDFFFGTSKGSRRDPDRYRDRVLARSIARANANRESEGLAPLPDKITPHSLRRTWAMLAAQAGRDPHWISDQIGHTSAAFTLQVYQQTRHRRLTQVERQAVWELMRFADEPEVCPFTR